MTGTTTVSPLSSAQQELWNKQFTNALATTISDICTRFFAVAFNATASGLETEPTNELYQKNVTCNIVERSKLLNERMLVVFRHMVTSTLANEQVRSIVGSLAREKQLDLVGTFAYRTAIVLVHDIDYLEMQTSQTGTIIDNLSTHLEAVKKEESERKEAEKKLESLCLADHKKT
jgi:hypothetical protein